MRTQCVVPAGRLRLVAAACLCIASVHAYAGAGKDALQSFFDDVKGFRADFTQRVLAEQASQIQVSSGKMTLQRPGRFRWDYLEPYSQAIIGDGTKVWIYDEDLEQVTVRSQDETLGHTPALLLSTDEPLDNRFEINELGVENDLDWVALVPKSADATFSTVRLAFRRGDLIAMELFDSLGNRTVLTFSNVERNPVLASDIFNFKVPPGVDVIGEDE